MISGFAVVTLVSDVTVDRFTLTAGGELTGGGTLTVTGQLSLGPGGAMRGPGTTRVPPAATLSLSGDGSASLTGGRQLVNEGTATWDGAFGFSNDNAGSAFVNRGTVALSASIPGGSAVFFAGRFVNEPGGTVPKTGPATSPFSSGSDNNGTVEVNEGTLRLGGFNGPGGTDSGTYTVAAGAVLDFGDTRTVTATGRVEGSGTLRLTTTVQTVFNGTLAVPTLDMGTVNNPTFVLNTDATVQTFALATGAMTWTTGSMSGTGTTRIAPGATLTISGDNTRGFSQQRQIVNEGAATWSGAGVFSNDNAGAAFVNRGTLDLTASIPDGSAVFSSGRFVNDPGAVLRRAGGGTSTFSSFFDNNGTVELNEGGLALRGFNGPGGTDTGTYAVCPTCMLTLVDFRTLSAGSVLTGTGTVFDNAGRALTNRATVRPGLAGQPVGTLAWSGPYAPAADGTLGVELGGATPGAQHDQLAVAGDAALGGTLRVRFVDGFTPAVVDGFDVATCAPCSGAFAALDLPLGVAGTVQVTASAARFVVGAVVAGEGEAAPLETTLAGPAPNPAAGRVRVRYSPGRGRPGPRGRGGRARP